MVGLISVNDLARWPKREIELERAYGVYLHLIVYKIGKD